MQNLHRGRTAGNAFSMIVSYGSRYGPLTTIRSNSLAFEGKVTMVWMADMGSPMAADLGVVQHHRKNVTSGEEVPFLPFQAQT